MAKIDRKARMQALRDTDGRYRAGGLRVAGMDEAGRGPLAGNVVAACVLLPGDSAIEWVDDSKKLSEFRREQVYEQIMAQALYVGIGQCTPAEIDELNILEATRRAMRRAAEEVPADVFLVDAVANLGLRGREEAIVHGDALSYAIAAASIVAKVTRDRQLRALHERYPGYGFDRNKGYGTAEHIRALKTLGPCPEHRRSFIGHFL